MATLSEHVGYKAGLAVTRRRIAQVLDNECPGIVLGDDEETLRIRSEVYGECLCKLLYAVGNIRSPESMPSMFGLYRRFESDKRLFPVYLAVQELFNRHCEESFHASTDPIDMNSFLDRAKAQHGAEGAHVALVIVQCALDDMHKSFLGNMRRVQWRNVAELEDLFRSESLATPHGQFFDQRFIDFLAHNYRDIEHINWRKFEGLTCEFFHRLGFHVEIGKGRDDDNVDVRIWMKEKRQVAPPLILVQCKREKEAVGKVVVKALYADIQHESARLGLIVTSSALAPGARKVCVARSYPIVEANRDALEIWVKAMRTPYSGVFLGE